MELRNIYLPTLHTGIYINQVWNLFCVCLDINDSRLLHFSSVELGLWCLMPLSTIFQLYRGGGNRSSWRKPPTCCKSPKNFITQCCIEYTSP